MRDFINGRLVKGGMPRVYAYVQSLRKAWGEKLLLVDGGDVLQGNPAVYYDNFIAPTAKSLAAEVMNYMHYDVGVIGNHDIEMGHAIYDKWILQCRFPVLGANVIDTTTGKCYLPPYHILERSGVRIAVLGMTTPAVLHWVPSRFRSDLHFEDILKTTHHWVRHIREQERPDVIVALLHSGKSDGIVTPEYAENAAFDVATQVPGLDVVCYGHDHSRNYEVVKGPDGRDVICCAPSNMAMYVSELDIDVWKAKDGTVTRSVTGTITDLSHFHSDESNYMQRFFKRHLNNTKYFVDRKIGEFSETITCEDSYFGPSAFVDLVHQAQLDITGAQISFAAPLTFAARINEGDVYVRDMFKLYRYENLLYVLRLKGHEVKAFLEMSYGLWTSRMQSPDDHLLWLEYVLGEGERLGFKNLAYNFDSAAGILYTVDVTKPVGGRIQIQSMADGTPFDEEADYTVVTNSYRGNGGGELMTKGAGIEHSRLEERLMWSSENDLRYYLIQYIEQKGTLNPQPLNHWRFIPEEWTEKAAERDRKILFPYRKTTKE